MRYLLLLFIPAMGFGQNPNPCFNVTNSATSGYVLSASGTGATPPCTWVSGGGSGVTSVTGTAPITSSGGTTPVIGISFTLASSAPICTLGSCGFNGSFSGATMLTATNQVWYLKIAIPYPGIVVNNVTSFAPVGGNVGHMSVGFMDSTCTKVSGGDSSTVTGASAQAAVNFPFSGGLSLPGGTYYLAFTSDNASSTMFDSVAETGYTGYIFNASQTNSTYPLFRGSNPSTTTTNVNTLPSTCGATRTPLQAQGTSYVPGMFIQ